MDEEPKHNPSYIPQIGIPEKEKFQEKLATRAIFHKATSPGFFGLIVIFFFLPFINIKCNGTVMKQYTGIDIIQGDENNTDKQQSHLVIGVRQSAYHQFEKARENFKWKRQLKEDYEKYIDDAPYFEDDFSASEDFYKMPETISETSRNPFMMRIITLIAMLSATAGLIVSFWNKIKSAYFQVVFASIGFICTFLLQYYVKITLPKVYGMDSYSTEMITTEFAMGYWMVFFLFPAVIVVAVMKIRWLKKWTQAKAEENTT